MSSSSTSQRTTRKSLFFWAVTGNLKIQILLLLVIIVMVFFRVVPLEMQKRIVNDSISLGRFDRLLLYCGIYLLAVTATAGMKLVVNYLQAAIGERAMLAMRRELYAHIIGLPLQFFRNTQPGMVVASLMTELNTAGAFAGMAIAVPVANILTLLAFAGYLLWLNSKLALATLGIYPVVAFLIPWLQKKANHLNKQRVDQSRLVANQIAESITGLTEINVHGAYNQETHKFNGLVESLRNIRIKWSLLRFGIKTVNNYFSSLGPFVVFLFGGYLVMEGQLEFGSLIAFLSAQEKLYDPWKELIEYYQVYQDASVRYYRTMQYFDLPVEHDQRVSSAPIPLLNGKLKVSNLVFTTASGVSLLKDVSFSLQAGEHLALVGFSGSGKSTLINCIAKMFDYSSGSILLDDREVKTMGKNEIIHHIGYISQHPFIFSGTILENLLYAHQAAAGTDPLYEGTYQPPDRDHLIFSLQQAGLFVDVIRFGLNRFLDSDATEMMARIVRVRKQFKKNYGQSLEQYIEFYRTDYYLQYASVVENIIFGAPVNRSFALRSLGEDARFRTFLETMDLIDELLLLGVELVNLSLDFLSDPDSSDLVAENLPIAAEQVDLYHAVLLHLGKDHPRRLSSADQGLLLTLALQFNPGLHNILAVSPVLEEKIVRARKEWKSWSDKNFSETFNSFSESEYIHGQSVLNNILQGRMKTEIAHAQEQVNQSIIRLLIEEDLLEVIAEFGMAYHLGSMGNSLSGGQKQKLAIARVLLKDPKIILMDESTSALDNKSQARIQNLIEQRWRGSRTVIAVVHRLDSIQGFDKIGVMKEGKLLEFGTYNELIEKNGLLSELVFGKS